MVRRFDDTLDRRRVLLGRPISDTKLLYAEAIRQSRQLLVMPCFVLSTPNENGGLLPAVRILMDARVKPGHDSLS